MNRGYFTHAFPAYASVQMRLLAVAFDSILVGLLLLMSAVMVAGDVWLRNPAAVAWMDIFLLLVCVPLLYFVGFWWLSCSSPGKMLLSLRLVDAATQQEPSGVQCLLRYVGYLVNVLSFGLGIVGLFDRNKPLGWHDRLSGTMIIQR